MHAYSKSRHVTRRAVMSVPQTIPVASASDDPVINLLLANELLVSRFYKVACGIFLLVLTAHLIFIGGFVLESAIATQQQVWLFGIFNLTVVVIELLLGRTAFMLGARSGQLKDVRLLLAMLGSHPDPGAFDSCARTLMALRRDSAVSLKLVDIEALAGQLKVS